MKVDRCKRRVPERRVLVAFEYLRKSLFDAHAPIIAVVSGKAPNSLSNPEMCGLFRR
jgi:hypothetical protein